MIYPESPNSIALIGNYLPRQCGIATFTTDLLEALATEAPEMDCWDVIKNWGVLEQENGAAPLFGIMKRDRCLPVFY